VLLQYSSCYKGKHLLTKIHKGSHFVTFLPSLVLLSHGVSLLRIIVDVIELIENKSFSSVHVKNLLWGVTLTVHVPVPSQ
jgi:hypothetical protein